MVGFRVPVPRFRSAKGPLLSAPLHSAVVSGALLRSAAPDPPGWAPSPPLDPRVWVPTVLEQYSVSASVSIGPTSSFKMTIDLPGLPRFRRRKGSAQHCGIFFFYTRPMPKTPPGTPTETNVVKGYTFMRICVTFLFES